MNKVVFQSAFVAAVFLLSFLMVLFSCDNNGEKGRQITDYKEYTLTVASKKVISGNMNYYSHNATFFSEVYSVKKENSQIWECFSGISGFGYESGFEYKIRVGETGYLDYSMGDPAWTEYKLLSVISKEKKESSDVPPAFFPEGMEFQPIDPQYVIDADEKEFVETDIENNPYLLWKHSIVINEDMSRFAVVDEKFNIVAIGAIEKETVESLSFPVSYKILVPEGEIAGYMNWEFTYQTSAAMDQSASRNYDVFLTLYPLCESKSPGESRYRVWIYKDLTEYYRNKFPDANVKAVVIRHTIS